jgi:hypothetical protein
MWEIVLGALVVIGIFVFWCDVTDAWNNVFVPTNAFSAFFKVANYLQGELRFSIRGGVAQHPDSIHVAKEVEQQAIKEPSPLKVSRNTRLC